MRFYFASALSKSGPWLEVFCIANCIKAPFYCGFTQRTSPASIPEPFRQHAQEYVVGFSASSVSIRFHSKGRQRVWRMINAFLRVTTENSPTELQLHAGLSHSLSLITTCMRSQYTAPPLSILYLSPLHHLLFPHLLLSLLFRVMEENRWRCM